MTRSLLKHEREAIEHAIARGDDPHELEFPGITPRQIRNYVDMFNEKYGPEAEDHD